MKYIFAALTVSLLLANPASADDNIANCEIVVQTRIDKKEVGDKAPVMATFMPATKFIFSVFDEKPGFLKQINGQPIRAVMCTRNSVIPTEFDLKIIRTSIPFYLSTDFDEQNSPFLAISKKDGKYVWDYSGPELSNDDKEALSLMMKELKEKK